MSWDAWITVIPAVLGMIIHLHYLNKEVDEETQSAGSPGHPFEFSDDFVARWTFRGAMLGLVSAAAAILIGRLLSNPQDWSAFGEDVVEFLLLGPAFSVGGAMATHRYLRILERSIRGSRAA